MTHLAEGNQIHSDPSDSVFHVSKSVILQRTNNSVRRTLHDLSKDHQGTSNYSILPTLPDTALFVHTDITHNLPMIDSNRSYLISNFSPVITSISMKIFSLCLIGPQTRSSQPRRSARVGVPPDRHGQWIVYRLDTTEIWHI